MAAKDNREFLADSEKVVEIVIMFSQAKHVFFKALNEHIADTGLNYAQACVLCALKTASRPLTISEISRFFFREIQSASELITRMEKRGYLEKIPALNDKRCMRIRLTPKGDGCVHEVASRMLDCYKRLLSPLTREQQEQFNECLGKIRNQAMEEMGMQIPESPAYIYMFRHELSEWLYPICEKIGQSSLLMTHSVSSSSPICTK